MEFEEAEQPTSQTVDVEQPSEPQAPASRFQGLGESIRRAVGIRVPLAASTARPGDRISDTITRFAQAAQERGLSADEAEAEARNRFGRLTPENYQELHQRAQQRSSLERERERVAGAEEHPIHRVLRNITPFASVFDIPEQNRLTAAQGRLQAGTATPEDTRRIAEHEQLARARGEQSHLAETLMGAVGMLGETFVTGGGSGAGANLLGRMGAWTGAQAAGRSVAGRAASFAGALAVTPSFYLSQAVDRNREQGRDAYDIRGFPPAVTNGAIQMAVFGSLGAIHEGLAASQVDSVVRRTARSLLEGTGVRGVAARVGARAAFGAAEQHAIIEPWTEAISDTLTPLIGHAYRLSTGDGAFRNALKGKWGEAWQQLGVSLITFGAFAAMHEISPAQPPGQNGAMVPASPNAPVPPSGAAGRGYLNLAQQAMQQLHGQGLNREQVLQRITSLVDPKVPVEQAMRGVDPMSPLGQFTIQTRQLGESQRQMNQQAGPPRLEGPKAPEAPAGPKPLVDQLSSHLDTVFGNAPRQSRVHPDGTVETGVLIRGEGGTRDRQVLMEFNPQKNTLKIDFQWEGGGKDVFQIGKGASRGSLNFAKQLRDVLTWAKENGVGISSEGKVDIRPDGSIDRSRQQSYDRQLSKMGFEKQADGTWRAPGAERQAASGEAPAAPPAAPQPTRERQLAQLDNYVKNSPSPEWVKQNVVAEATGAIRSGLASKVEDLAAQHKTAKQIAKELNIDVETVNAVRNALGIPSMSAPTATAKFGEASPVTQEFQAWRDAHLQRSQSEASASPKSKAEQRLENMRARQQEVKTPEQPKRPQAAPEVKAEIQKTIKEHESWNAAKSVVEDVKAGRDVPHDRLEEANRTLDFTPAEARVFWGTRGPNGVPLAEIGRRMGVSRQRAQQLEASANRKAAEASSAETRAESRAGRAAETPSAREAGMAEGYHEQGAISQERLDLLHDKLTQLLDKAIETGELIDHKTANDIINRFAGEERAAYEQLLRDAGNTPSVRAAAEQVVQSSREGQPNPFESEAGPRVQPGEEAARPAAERGAGPEANQPANAPADAGRGAAGENVVGQPEGAVPQPSRRGLLGEEHGSFVPQQFVENLGKLWTKFKIGWKTRLERLANVEAEALATGKYSVPKEGDKLTEIAKAMENANSPTAKVFEERGIYTLKNGKEFTVGQPFEKLLEPLKHDPADLKPISGHLLNQVGHWFEKPENATRFDVYTLARSIVDEAQRTPQGIVPAPWLAEARTVLQQFQLDPAFTARANQVHSDLIKYVWNASLLARAAPEVHNLSPAEAIDYIQAHPLYVDARRGMKPEEFLIPNKAYNTMERSGPSDRPFMPPLETARQRLSETAAVINEQIIRNAVEKVLATPGLEHWSKRITAQEAADPRVASWRWNDQNGKATYREIKDKALYEVLSGTQGQADPVLQAIKWFSDIELGTGHKILPLISQVQRTTATTLNLAFQVFNNSIRDVYTAISNTRSPGEMVKRIPEMYKRAYMAEWAILTGKIPKDPIFRELKELRGEEMRPTNFGGSPSSSIPTMSTWKDFAKQALRVLGAGELAPRMQELREVYRRQGWSEERISREREAAEQAAAQGKPYVHPIPLSERIAAGNAAREVTVNFGLGGTYVNEINRIVPFFRPAVNGVWKEIHNWRHNTQGAAMALAAYLGARLAHWAMFSGEEWWKDLSGFDKFNNFVVPIGGQLYRIPGPRDMAIPAGGLLTSALDHATDRNPRWRDLWKQGREALQPNSFLPVPAQIAWDLHGNEDFLGRDIVPERDQRLPASHNLTQHQIPYVLRQLSGGRLQPNLRGLTGFGGAIRPTARLDDYYQELQSLESERALARRQGRAFSGEPRYQTLHGSDLARSIRQLGQEYRTATDERRRDVIRRQQNQLAGQLLRAR